MYFPAAFRADARSFVLPCQVIFVRGGIVNKRMAGIAVCPPVMPPGFVVVVIDHGFYPPVSEIRRPTAGSVVGPV
jgi:hypothetical protein